MWRAVEFYENPPISADFTVGLVEFDHTLRRLERAAY